MAGIRVVQQIGSTRTSSTVTASISASDLKSNSISAGTAWLGPLGGLIFTIDNGIYNGRVGLGTITPAYANAIDVELPLYSNKQIYALSSLSANITLLGTTTAQSLYVPTSISAYTISGGAIRINDIKMILDSANGIISGTTLSAGVARLTDLIVNNSISGNTLSALNINISNPIFTINSSDSVLSAQNVSAGTARIQNLTSPGIIQFNSLSGNNLTANNITFVSISAIEITTTGSFNIAGSLDVTGSSLNSFIARFSDSNSAMKLVINNDGDLLSMDGITANSMSAITVSGGTGRFTDMIVNNSISSGTITSNTIKIEESFPGLILNRINNASTYPYILFNLESIPRTYIGVASATNGIINDAVSGDLNIRTQGNNILFSTSNGTSANMILRTDGKIGIGITNNLLAQLHLTGSISASGITSIGTLLISENQAIIKSSFGAGGVPTFKIQRGDGTTTYYGSLGFYSANGTKGWVLENNVLIGDDYLEFNHGTTNYGGFTPVGNLTLSGSVKINSASGIEINTGTAGVPSILKEGNSDLSPFLQNLNPATNYGWGFFNRSTEGDFNIERRVGGNYIEAFRIIRATGDIKLAASLSASNITGSRIYTLNTSPLANDELASKYYVDSVSAAAISGVAGGSINYLSKFNTATTLNSSIIYQSGNKIGIGTTSPLLAVQIAAESSSLYPLQLTTNDFENSASGSRILFAFGAVSGNTTAAIQTDNIGGLAATNLLLQGNGGLLITGGGLSARSISSNNMIVAPLSGSQTNNYIPKVATVNNTLVNSSIVDDGSTVTINTNLQVGSSGTGTLTAGATTVNGALQVNGGAAYSSTFTGDNTLSQLIAQVNSSTVGHYAELLFRSPSYVYSALRGVSDNASAHTGHLEVHTFNAGSNNTAVTFNADGSTSFGTNAISSVGSITASGIFTSNVSGASLTRHLFQNSNVVAQETDIEIRNASGSIYLGLNYGATNSYLDNRSGGDFLYKYNGTTQLTLATTGNATFAGTGTFNGTGTHTFAGDIAPTNDNQKTLGSSQKRWSDVFAAQTTVGGIFETGLRTENIGDNLTGTIVSWYKGKLIPCYKEEDTTVMGVIKHGKDEPIILGAEHVLVTGNVKEGDFIVTSKKIGHGKAVKKKWLGLINRSLTGKIIGQALEDASGESNLIKVYIYKH